MVARTAACTNAFAFAAAASGVSAVAWTWTSLAFGSTVAVTDGVCEDAGKPSACLARATTAGCVIVCAAWLAS